MVFDFSKYRSLTKNALFQKELGRDKVPLMLVLGILKNKVINGDVTDRASAVAFNLTLAVFPFIIFLFALIPFFPIKDIENSLFAELNKLINNRTLYYAIYNTVFDIVHNRHHSLLSMGFLAAIYTATTGMMAFMSAFNASFRIKEKRSYIFQRLLSLLLTTILAMLLLITIVLIVYGELILNVLLSFKILQYDIFYYSIDIMRYVTVILAFFAAILIIYYFAPDKKLTFKALWRGAAFTTLFSVLVSVAFSFYFVNFNTYNKLYGAIGTMIGFMVWLYFISFIIIVGFEMNVSVLIAKRITIRNLANSTKKI